MEIILHVVGVLLAICLVIPPLVFAQRNEGLIVVPGLFFVILVNADTGRVFWVTVEVLGGLAALGLRFCFYLCFSFSFSFSFYLFVFVV